MSHDAHGASNGGVPPAHMLDKLGFGIPNGALLFVLFSIILAIMQGSFVVASSPWGHSWPSTNSTTVTLPPSHLSP